MVDAALQRAERPAVVAPENATASNGLRQVA